jgi:hypothetical protein
VDTPQGQVGRPSQSLTLDEARALLAAAEKSRLLAFIVTCSAVLRWPSPNRGATNVDGATAIIHKRHEPRVRWHLPDDVPDGR